MVKKCLLVDDKGPFSEELVEKMAFDLCNKLNYIANCENASKKYKLGVIIRLGENDIKIKENIGVVVAKFLFPTSEVIPIELTWILNQEDPFGKLVEGIDPIWDAAFPEREIREIVKKAKKVSPIGVGGEINLPDVEVKFESKIPFTSSQLHALESELKNFRDHYKIYMSELETIDPCTVLVNYDCYYALPDFDLLFEKISGLKGLKGNISIQVS